MTTSRMAPQIDNIEERLEGTNFFLIFHQTEIDILTHRSVEEDRDPRMDI